MAAKEKGFQGEKIENLIQCLANFKAKMGYNNSDFNADKVKQYEAVREVMARIYEDEPTFFGPPGLSSHHYQRHQTRSTKRRWLKFSRDRRLNKAKG